jgi:hypothetical protein
VHVFLVLLMAFGYYKSVTIDHGQVGASDLTDYPVTIWVTDADLATVANGGKVQSSSGYDIRPYADSGASSALTFELPDNPTGSTKPYVATTGQLEMHVKIPTVSHTSDTVFYLFFGDASLTTDGSSTGTWNSGFNQVWHFGPLGTTPDVNFGDSTSHANTLTQSPTVSYQTGQIDGGAGMLGSSGYAFAAGINDFTASAFTLSMWIHTALTTNIGGIGPVFLYKGQGNINGYFFRALTDGTVGLVTNQLGAKQESTSNAGTLAANTWTYLSAIRNGASVKVLKNGVDVTSTSASHTDPTSSSDNFQVGSYNDGFIQMDGIVDEVRVSNTDRTVDWELATYNNQKTSSTFLAWGALTPVGAASTDTTWFQRRATLLPNYWPTWIKVP